MQRLMEWRTADQRQRRPDFARPSRRLRRSCQAYGLVPASGARRRASQRGEDRHAAQWRRPDRRENASGGSHIPQGGINITGVYLRGRSWEYTTFTKGIKILDFQRMPQRRSCDDADWGADIASKIQRIALRRHVPLFRFYHGVSGSGRQ